MSTILHKLEDQLIERLKTYLSSPFYVASFPDRPEQFDLANYDAVLLVSYGRSRYGKPQNGAASQEREVHFTLQLFLSGLRGSDGDQRFSSYAGLETVRQAVQNVRLQGCQPFYRISEQLAGREADRYEWQIEIACETLAVA
ncbi:MAG: Gp37 family protein, partial [Cohaesibacter sp.]|nr:Gp37 family protein [Cohaesibacter sp.]